MLRWLFDLWRHLPEPRITFEQLRDLLAEPDPLQTLFDRYMDYLFSRYRYRVEVHEDDYERFRARLDRVVIGEADVALSRAMQVEPFLHDDMLGPGGACREYVFSWHLYRGRYHTLVDGLPYTALAWALRGGSPAGSAAAGSGDAASVPYADYVLEEPEADVGALADAAYHWRRRCWRTAPRRRRSAVLRRLVDFAGLFTVAPFRAALCPPSPDLSGPQPVVLDSVDLLVRGGAAVVLDLSSLGRSREAGALGWMMKRAWLDAASLPRPLPRRTALLVADSYEDLVAGRLDAAADAAAFSGAGGRAAVPLVRAGSARRLEAAAGRSGLSMLVDAAGAVLVLGGAGWARRLARLLLPGACADRVAACAARLGSLSGAGALARVGPSTLVRLTVFTEDLSDPGSRTGRLRRLAGGFMDAVSRLCSRRRGAATLSRADSG